MEWTQRQSTYWNSDTDTSVPSPDQYWLQASRRDDKPPLSHDVSIEAHFHYNGSGPKAFGGAKSWPVASLDVGFPEGQIAKRNKFVKALQGFLDDYFKDENNH